MEGKIFQSIAAIMEEVSAISKDKVNQKQGFKFRGIDDVYNALHPLMAKHKIFTVPEVISKESTFETSQGGHKLFYERIMVRYTFFADDGSSFQSTVYGIGMDSGDKAANKAMAIAHKYVLLQVFCIPTEDMSDPDSETPLDSMDQSIQQPPTPRTKSQGAAKAVTPPTPPKQPQPAQGTAPVRPQGQINGTVTGAGKRPAMTDKERAQKGLLIGKYINNLLKEISSHKIPSEQWKAWLKGVYGYTSIYDVVLDAYQGILQTLREHPEQIINYKEPPPRQPGED